MPRTVNRSVDWSASSIRLPFSITVRSTSSVEIGPATVTRRFPFPQVYAAAPGVKGKLARWAFRLFDEYVEARRMGRSYESLGWSLAKRLVFSKVRAQLDEKLGGKMRRFISGGAPLSPKIGYFFDLLGFEVLEGYGLTETSAATVVNPPGGAKIGTVGRAMPGTVAVR